MAVIDQIAVHLSPYTGHCEGLPYQKLSKIFKELRAELYRTLPPETTSVDLLDMARRDCLVEEFGGRFFVKTREEAALIVKTERRDSLIFRRDALIEELDQIQKELETL